MAVWGGALALRVRALVATLAMAGAAAAVPGASNAATACTATATPGVERCVSGLSAAAVTRIYQAQEESNWCWAASISMILRRYGVAIPQQQVVRTALGAPANERAGAAAMSELLARPWEDASGHAGVAKSEPLAPWRRALGVAAPEVIADLAEGKPLLLGVQQHAMVLVQVTYERRTDGQAITATGVRVLRALVLDPASANWLRSLDPEERQPDYLARVTVEVQRPAALALAAPGGELPQ